MKRGILLAVALTSLIGAGCSSDKSKELLDMAQFEEKQNNQEHARKLYAEIAAKYPNTAAAKQAKERLDALGTKR
jgi:TolA-binding protein